MGVYIKDMKMPQSCANCPIRAYDIDDQEYCGATGNSIRMGFFRPDDCPLVPVPPHGRLIDADAAAKQGWTISRTYSASPNEMVHEVKTMTDDVLPTIIQAEEGE